MDSYGLVGLLLLAVGSVFLVRRYRTRKSGGSIASKELSISEATTILGNYGEVLEREAKQRIHFETSLPYPKPLIKRAILTMLASGTLNDYMSKHLLNGYVELGTFLPNASQPAIDAEEDFRMAAEAAMEAKNETDRTRSLENIARVGDKAAYRAFQSLQTEALAEMDRLAVELNQLGFTQQR